MDPNSKLQKIAPKTDGFNSVTSDGVNNPPTGCFVRTRDIKLGEKRLTDQAKAQLDRLASVTHNSGIRLGGGIKRKAPVNKSKTTTNQVGGPCQPQSCATVCLETANATVFSQEHVDAHHNQTFPETSIQVPSVSDQERLDLIMNSVAKELPTSLDFSNEKAEPSKRSWATNNQQIEQQFDESRESIIDQVLLSNAPSVRFCQKCQNMASQIVIYCESCYGDYCEECDYTIHHTLPYHQRRVIDGIESYPLLPQWFFVNGKKIIKDVAVPLRLPVNCSICNRVSRHVREVGIRQLIVVTKNGRYDLNSTMFRCVTCNEVRDAALLDFIDSGYVPGCINGSYLFTTDVLYSWYLSKHCTPGTSLLKFIETIIGLSKLHGRNDIINNQAFHQASRQYEFIRHLIDRDIKKINKALCSACYLSPIGYHTDGNKKLYSFDHERATSLSKRLISGLPDSVLLSDDAVKMHTELLNSKIGNGRIKESCGDATYQAGRSDGTQLRGLANTGLMLSVCRHCVVLKSANLKKGENYRVVHLMHHDAFVKGASFFCYDVICTYWPFAQNVANVFRDSQPEFTTMLERTKRLLSTVHGQTHTRSCQLTNSGRYMIGAGAFNGEAAELVNATMSRYGNSTKHQDPAHRDETTTGAIYFWNSRKEDKMALFLVKSLVYAKHFAREYKLEFERLLSMTSLTESDVDRALVDMVKNLDKTKSLRKKKSMTLFEAEDKIEEARLRLFHIKWQMSHISDSCSMRADLRRKQSALGIKVQALITDVNRLQNDYQLTNEDFESGNFPWLDMASKDFWNEYELLDVLMLSRRYGEEIGILIKEMHKHLQCLMDQRRVLMDDIGRYCLGLNCSALGNEIYLSSLSLTQRLNLGKASRAQERVCDIEQRLKIAFSYFSSVETLDLEALQDAFEEENEQAIEQIWNEIIENMEDGSTD